MKKQRRKKPRPQFVEPPQPPLDQFELLFEPPLFGCLHFTLRLPTGDWEIRPSNLDDPFERMLFWLEEIVGGADTARWLISEEGSLTQLIFAREAKPSIDSVTAHLILLRSNERGDTHHLSNCAVTPIGMAAKIYRAFRSYVDSDAYLPEEWELIGDPEDWPWRGLPLRQMRSLAVEAALNRVEPTQLSFQVTFRPGRP